MQITEEKYRVSVKHGSLGKRNAKRTMVFANGFILVVGIIMTIHLNVPLIYTFPGVLVFAVLFSIVIHLDRNGMGTRVIFSITFNNGKIGVLYENIEDPFKVPHSREYAINSIERISYDSKKCRLIFRPVTKRDFYFLISDDISETTMSQMLAIATKESEIPFEILDSKKPANNRPEKPANNRPGDEI